MVKGALLTLRLEDKGSNELFAACPVEQFPGMSVEPVTDSSRYFVICIKVMILCLALYFNTCYYFVCGDTVYSVAEWSKANMHKFAFENLHTYKNGIKTKSPQKL